LKTYLKDVSYGIMADVITYTALEYQNSEDTEMPDIDLLEK
jgi:hypothetical protein